jgi:hypothetical protein
VLSSTDQRLFSENMNFHSSDTAVFVRSHPGPVLQLFPVLEPNLCSEHWSLVNGNSLRRMHCGMWFSMALVDQTPPDMKTTEDEALAQDFLSRPNHPAENVNRGWQTADCSSCRTCGSCHRVRRFEPRT